MKMQRSPRSTRRDKIALAFRGLVQFPVVLPCVKKIDVIDIQHYNFGYDISTSPALLTCAMMSQLILEAVRLNNVIKFHILYLS